MTKYNRRTFLKASALTATGIAVSARSWGQVVGANSDIRVAVVGRERQVELLDQERHEHPGRALTQRGLQPGGDVTGRLEEPGAHRGHDRRLVDV